MLNNYLFITYQGIVILFLVFLRVSSIMFFVPIFGQSPLPRRIKIAIYFVISLAIYPVVKKYYLNFPLNNLGFLFYAGIFEVFVGTVIGFVSLFLFATVLFAGEQIGFNMSFGMVKSIDPTHGLNLTVISQFQNIFTYLIFLCSPAYTKFLEILIKSFFNINLNSHINIGGLSHFLVDLSNKMFIYGVELALPIIILAIVINLVLAILNRMVSGLNVFLMSLNLRIGLGIIVFIAFLPIFFKLILKIIEVTFKALERVFVVI